MQFSINIVTVDRTERGARNYLGQTLRSMAESGLFGRDNFTLDIWDSGSLNPAWIAVEARSAECGMRSANGGFRPERIGVHIPERRLTQNENFARALRGGTEPRLGIGHNPDFVVLCEDDIEVSRRWLERMEAWLNLYFEGHKMATFYTPYVEVEDVLRSSRTGSGTEPRLGAWPYPVEKFYGACCFAVRPETALGLADTLERRAESAHEADLWMKKYFREGDLVAAVPSLVQHIGDESGIQPAGAPKRRGFGFRP